MPGAFFLLVIIHLIVFQLKNRDAEISSVDKLQRQLFLSDTELTEINFYPFQKKTAIPWKVIIFYLPVKQNSVNNNLSNKNHFSHQLPFRRK